MPERSSIVVNMNQLSTEKRTAVVRCLVEGMSIRATVRVTGAAKNTIVKLLVQLGEACAEHHDKAVRNVTAQRVQCDEIWSFCYAKQKNVPADKAGQFGYGDVWTWTALDRDSKLCISWMVGGRDADCAKEFMGDVASRLANRVQLTTDGHSAYLSAVEHAFGGEVDYAQLIKVYGRPEEPNTRYSPPVCIGTETKVIQGSPNKRDICTSHVERSNLTMRMGMRRFTRLTNGFSKKVENLAAAISLHFAHYNFCRIHQTLRVTPAMAAGLTDRVWEIEDLISLMN